METTVIDWGWSSFQSSAYRSLCLSKFCVASWKDPPTFGIRRSLEEKGWRDHDWSKLQNYDGINGELTEFEWNIFPGFTELQFWGKVTHLLSNLGETPETFTGRILFMSMFNDISCHSKNNKEECLANARVVKVFAKKFGIGHWSFFGPGSEKKWYSEENSPQKAWDRIADEMLLKFTESGHPNFQCNDSIVQDTFKSKEHGKLSVHFTADYPTIETIFRIIFSAKQISFYGAVANMCEEFEAHQDRSKERDVLIGQSIVFVKLRQKFFCRMKTLWIIKFYGNSTKNESNHFHKREKRVNSVWQDLYMLLKWDRI